MHREIQKELLVARLLRYQPITKQALQNAMTSVADNFSGPAAGYAGDAADLAIPMIPFVGGAYMGMKGLNDIRQGNYWSGAGNLIGGAVSEIPEVGGGLVDAAKLGIKGIGRAGRALGWAGKAEKLAPTISKGFGALPNLMTRGENAMKGLSSQLPGMNRFMQSGPGKWMSDHSFATNVMAGTSFIPGIGVKNTLNHMQSASDIGKQMASGNMGGSWAEQSQNGGSAVPSAKSLLGMAGFGGGEQDPRYMMPGGGMKGTSW